MRIGKKILGAILGLACIGALASCKKGGSESTSTIENNKLYKEISYSGMRDTDEEETIYTLTLEGSLNFKTKHCFCFWFKSELDAKITSIDLTFTYKQGDWTPEASDEVGNIVKYIYFTEKEEILYTDNLVKFNNGEYIQTHEYHQINEQNYERNIPYSFNYPVNQEVTKGNYFSFYSWISEATFSNLKINYEKI